MIYLLATLLAILWPILFKENAVRVSLAILIATFIYSLHDNGE